eukprot:m.333877 g.333877  ORF g.333877 m.333877 type:complete len:120 (-) comp17238_c0_seq1:133-492(-)
MSNKKTALMAAIVDEDTCTGLLLGGIGQIDAKRNTNYFVVEKDTSLEKVEEVFKGFLNRPDIAIIIINQHIAEDIQRLITEHDQPVPTIVIIPSKDFAYDPEKDPEMQRAKQMFSSDDR